MVAGFFVRHPYRPLGEVRIDGGSLDHEPVAEPWAQACVCLHVDGTVRIAPGNQLAETTAGDLLQAGPPLVHDGRSAIDGSDREGSPPVPASSTRTSPLSATRDRARCWRW